MDEVKVFVDLKPLTDEEIKAKNFGLEDLWMVKIEGRDPYGPYDTTSLKDYAHKYEFLFKQAKVYNLESDQWFDMFAVSQFQRRKPQLVSAQNLINTQQFYILYNGQKDGPHGQDKIQKLLDSGMILPSTQVSLDNGKSWIKLYEHHAFDRRTKKSNQELPFRPNEEVLEKVKSTKEQILKIKETEDALVEFARLGQGGDLEQVDSDIDIELEERSVRQRKISKYTSATTLTPEEVAALKKLKKSKKAKVTSDNSNSSVWWKYATAFLLVVGVGFAFLNSNQRPKVLQQVQVTNTKPVESQPKSIDNSERQIIKKQTRTPASLRQQQTPKVLPKVRRSVSKPKRIKKRPKRYVRKKAPLKEVFERDIETIDINDPEVQDELTRQLAGEYADEREDEREEDSGYQDEREDEREDYREQEDNPYNDEQPQDDNPYGDEPVEHQDY